MESKEVNYHEMVAALTIVIGNDIVIPEVDIAFTMLDTTPKITGYKWQYKGVGVWVSLSRIVDATTLFNECLDSRVEAMRLHVKQELYRALSKEANK